MEIIDNRHFDYNNIVQHGDLISTKHGQNYIFTCDENDEYLPYSQIDLNTFTVVDRYPHEAFKELTIGTEMTIGGEIVEIIKNKNLVLDIRK